MTTLRSVWLMGFAAALAACSGNLGGGQTTLPGMPQNGQTVQSVAAAAPSASPVSASNVATVGDAVAPQALPTIGGYGGTIAFAKPSAAPVPSPGATGSAPPPAPVSIGVTTGTVAPPDAPSLGTTGKRHRPAGASADPQGVFFISLLATSDVALPEYPRIAVDVPREIVAKYRDDVFGLALYDPERAAKTYALGVAQRDFSSPAPSSVVSPAPVTSPSPTPAPGAPGSVPAAFTPPPIGTGLDAGGLPPEHVGFSVTPKRLNLKANRPVVFALYVLAPSPSPSPSASTRPHTGASPAASPTGSASAAPVASAAPSATASPAP